MSGATTGFPTRVGFHAEGASRPHSWVEAPRCRGRNGRAMFTDRAPVPRTRGTEAGRCTPIGGGEGHRPIGQPAERGADRQIDAAVHQHAAAERQQRGDEFNRSPRHRARQATRRSPPQASTGALERCTPNRIPRRASAAAWRRDAWPFVPNCTPRPAEAPTEG